MKKFAQLWMIGALAASGAALAEQPGSTSGPATGTNVTPSTSLQKGPYAGDTVHPNNASGLPGVEAKRGTEGGKAPEKMGEPMR